MLLSMSTFGAASSKTFSRSSERSNMTKDTTISVSGSRKECEYVGRHLDLVACAAEEVTPPEQRGAHPGCRTRRVGESGARPASWCSASGVAFGNQNCRAL